MKQKLIDAIKSCKNSNDPEKNIAIIGEYGSGKSTLIKSISDNYETIDISLMSSLQKQTSLNENNVNSLQLNIDILNNIFHLLKISLVDIDKNSHIYPDSLSAEKKRRNAKIEIFTEFISLFLVSDFLIRPYLIYLVHTPVMGSALIVILIFLLLLLCTSIHTLYINSEFKIKKIFLSSKDVTLELDKNNNVLNEEQFIQGISYFIELYFKDNNNQSVIINFEDLDRIAGPITLEFLREVNIKLNLIHRPNYNIIFLYSIRTGILEKNAKKGIDTRSRTKIEKYFNHTIYIKSINAKHYKSFIFDLNEIGKPEDLKYYNDLNLNILNMIEEAFQTSLHKFEETHIELYTDFRVYKAFFDLLNSRLKNFFETYNKDELNLSIRVALAGIIESTMMQNASKHSVDFINFYQIIIEDIQWYNTKGSIQELDAIKLINSIERKIIRKYSVSNNSIFSRRERKYFIKFITEDFKDDIKLIERHEFLSIIGIDPEELYLKKVDIPYATYSNILINQSMIEYILDNADKFEKDMLIENIKNRPNKYLKKKVQAIFSEYAEEEITSLIIRWSKTLIKENGEIPNMYSDTFEQSELVYALNQCEDKEVVQHLRKLPSLSNNTSSSFEKAYQQVERICIKANQQELSTIMYKEVLREMLQNENGITRNSVTGKLYERIDNDYIKLRPDHKGRKHRSSMVKTVYKNL